MPVRRIIVLLALVGVLCGVVFYFSSGPDARPVQNGLSTPRDMPVSAQSLPRSSAADSRLSVAAKGESPSPIADALNQPGRTVERDLEIVQDLLVAWQSNFPREGNPVGENAEITAALAGENRMGYSFIRRSHPAINARGELCDRWGTPFRFHQLSGTQMEIRSAGPDRRFATADDAVWPSPPPAQP